MNTKPGTVVSYGVLYSKTSTPLLRGASYRAPYHPVFQLSKYEPVYRFDKITVRTTTFWCYYFCNTSMSLKMLNEKLFFPLVALVRRPFVTTHESIGNSFLDKCCNIPYPLLYSVRSSRCTKFLHLTTYHTQEPIRFHGSPWYHKERVSHITNLSCSTTRVLRLEGP